MINVVSFVVPGEPQGKGRARVGKVGGHARMFTPAKTVAYEGLIAMAAQQAMRGGAPLEGPLALSVEAVATIPASWSKKRRSEALAGLLRPTTKPDIDNIVKAVGDGANGVAWGDDRQIVQLTALKRYGERPELRVIVARIEPGEPGVELGL